MVDDVESCELRNCECGSTIAVEIEAADPHADTERPKVLSSSTPRRSY